MWWYQPGTRVEEPSKKPIVHTYGITGVTVFICFFVFFLRYVWCSLSRGCRYARQTEQTSSTCFDGRKKQARHSDVTKKQTRGKYKQIMFDLFDVFKCHCLYPRVSIYHIVPFWHTSNQGSEAIWRANMNSGPETVSECVHTKRDTIFPDPTFYYTVSAILVTFLSVYGYPFCRALSGKAAGVSGNTGKGSCTT